MSIKSGLKMAKESFHLKNERLGIITFQKLPNYFGQHNVAKGFKKFPK